MASRVCACIFIRAYMLKAVCVISEWAFFIQREKIVKLMILIKLNLTTSEQSAPLNLLKYQNYDISKNKTGFHLANVNAKS